MIGWSIATAIGLAVIYGPYSVFKPNGTLFNTAQNIFYASLSRLAWALALAWVVYACQYRMGGKYFFVFIYFVSHLKLNSECFNFFKSRTRVLTRHLTVLWEQRVALQNV